MSIKLAHAIINLCTSLIVTLVISSHLQITDGYSGSDIKLVCKEAAMRPVRKVFDKLEAPDDTDLTLRSVELDPVRTADIEAAIASTKPSARQLVGRYLAWQREYEST